MPSLDFWKAIGAGTDRGENRAPEFSAPDLGGGLAGGLSFSKATSPPAPEMFSAPDYGSNPELVYAHGFKAGNPVFIPAEAPSTGVTPEVFVGPTRTDPLGVGPARTDPWGNEVTLSELRQLLGTRGNLEAIYTAPFQEDFADIYSRYLASRPEPEPVYLALRNRRADERLLFDPKTFNPVQTMFDVYPGINPESRAELSKAGVIVSSRRGLGLPSAEYLPDSHTVRFYAPYSMTPDYRPDPGVSLHEYAHAMSLRGQTDLIGFGLAYADFLARPGPYWELARPFWNREYGWDSVTEAYAEIARRSDGDLRNIPPDLRPYYGWLR